MNTTDSRSQSRKLLHEESSDRPISIIEDETAPSFKRDQDDPAKRGLSPNEIRRGLQRDYTPEKRGNGDSSFLSDYHSSKSPASPNILERGDLINRFELHDIDKIISCVDNPKELVYNLQRYQPRSKFIEIDLLRKSKTVKIKRYKDAVYFGELYNDKRHGKGILIYYDLHLYEGDWENDIKHGKGFELTPNGSRYEGQYWNGRPEGFGVFVWNNGELYEGEWKNGVKHGSGMWKGIKGESYLGEWRFGKQDGNGVFIWRNGDKYEGEFKAFLKHGHGTEKFANGDYYSGNYRNGKPHGYGEYFWANGSQYKGFFKNGLRHGKGHWKNGHGQADEYDGEWANDKRCGYGVFKWISGNYYEGEFFDDARQGYGIMHWIDGSYYKGYWERGIQHGEGELVVPGHPPKIGLFQNNVFVGEGDESDHPEELEGNRPRLKPGLKTPMKHVSRTEIGSSGKKKKIHLPEISPNRHNQDANESSEESMERSKKSKMSEKDLHYERRKKKKKDDEDLSFISEQPRKKLPPLKKARAKSQGKTKKPLDISPRLYSEDMAILKPDNCLLTQKEYIKWNRIKYTLGIDLRKYRDLSKPEICARIRAFILPPVWRPAGALKIERGRSDIGNALLVVNPDFRGFQTQLHYFQLYFYSLLFRFLERRQNF